MRRRSCTRFIITRRCGWKSDTSTLNCTLYMRSEKTISSTNDRFRRSLYRASHYMCSGYSTNFCLRGNQGSLPSRATDYLPKRTCSYDSAPYSTTTCSFAIPAAGTAPADEKRTDFNSANSGNKTTRI